MYDARNFRRLAELLSVETKKSVRQIGREAVGIHGIFHRLDDRRSCTLPMAERLQQYFEAVWPDGLLWPDDIPRRRQLVLKRKAETESGRAGGSQRGRKSFSHHPGECHPATEAPHTHGDDHARRARPT